MKSITQFNQEKDTKSLIYSFTKLIGLGDLSKKVNFKRHSLVSLLMVITWMIKARFARKLLYRCQRAKNFTAKTARKFIIVTAAAFMMSKACMNVWLPPKRGSKGKYLVLATTQYKLHPQEIIQLYGRRWQIETYFKAAKQYLALNKSQIQSYDGQCGYIAVTALTYDLLAWQERQSIDDRTLGDLFYLI